MTPNKNETIFFQKVYYSSLQGNKNGQICASFVLLKDEVLSASEGRALPPESLTRGSDPEPRLGLCPQILVIVLRFVLAI